MEFVLKLPIKHTSRQIRTCNPGIAGKLVSLFHINIFC